jgi:hypothetical protein
LFPKSRKQRPVSRGRGKRGERWRERQGLVGRGRKGHVVKGKFLEY